MLNYRLVVKGIVDQERICCAEAVYRVRSMPVICSVCIAVCALVVCTSWHTLCIARRRHIRTHKA